MAAVVALSSPAVAPVSAARPQRRAACSVVRPRALLRPTAPLRRTARSAPLRTRVRATNEEETGSQMADDATYSAKTNLAGTIFGTYLQLGVWIATLSFAGYTAYQKGQEDPSAVGVLAGPPAAAIFLIASFLIFKVITNKEKQAKKAAKAEAEE